MDSVNNVETKNSKYLVSGGYAYSGISNERIKIAMAGYLKDLKTWIKHCENRFTNDGCEKFLQILDMIDAGVNPNALEDKVKSDEDDIVEIEIKDEKHKRRSEVQQNDIHYLRNEIEALKSRSAKQTSN